MIEQAPSPGGPPRRRSAPTTEGRVAALFRAVLARSPASAELQAAARFVDEPAHQPGESGQSRLSRWEQLAQVLLMSNELLFVD